MMKIKPLNGQVLCKVWTRDEGEADSGILLTKKLGDEPVEVSIVVAKDDVVNYVEVGDKVGYEIKDSIAVPSHLGEFILVPASRLLMVVDGE